MDDVIHRRAGCALVARVLPFDFTHLADLLPADLQFILAWMSDGIEKLLLQVAVGVLAALFTIAYVARVMVTLNSRRL
ncbi:MAG TPA: hypothetical protein VGF38_22085 [Ktedonobacterales bacterium]